VYGELRCLRVNRDLPEICSRAPEGRNGGVGAGLKSEERYQKSQVHFRNIYMCTFACCLSKCIARLIQYSTNLNRGRSALCALCALCAYSSDTY
jgi:hypothetical protein